jgi:hypothetical protein
MSFSIVIPSGSLSNLAACVRSIREAGETCRIIVVSDGLDLDAPPVMNHETLALLTSRVELHDGVKPFSITRNQNIGICAAGGDDVILAGDDTMLKTAGGFTALSRLAAEKPDYGIIAPAVNFCGNRNQYALSCLNTNIPPFRDELLMLCSVCWYIPHGTIEKVGLLDERFGTDYGLDDDDYSWRVRAAGLKLGVWDGCFLDHRHLPSVWRSQPGKYDCTVNMRRFIEKWGLDNHGLPREKSPFAYLFPAIT